MGTPPKPSPYGASAKRHWISSIAGGNGYHNSRWPGEAGSDEGPSFWLSPGLPMRRPVLLAGSPTHRRSPTPRFHSLAKSAWAGLARATGFEPAASCSQSRRSSKLSYTRMLPVFPGCQRSFPPSENLLPIPPPCSRYSNPEV